MPAIAPSIRSEPDSPTAPKNQSEPPGEVSTVHLERAGKLKGSESRERAVSDASAVWYERANEVERAGPQSEPHELIATRFGDRKP